MRNCILAIGCWLLAIGCGAKGPAKTQETADENDGYVMNYEKEYTAEDSALVVKLLAEAATQRGKENRMMYFGKKFLGLPYVGGTLENGDREHLIVNLHGLDCTTYVETVTAGGATIT